MEASDLSSTSFLPRALVNTGKQEQEKERPEAPPANPRKRQAAVVSGVRRRSSVTKIRKTARGQSASGAQKKPKRAGSASANASASVSAPSASSLTEKVFRPFNNTFLNKNGGVQRQVTGTNLDKDILVRLTARQGQESAFTPISVNNTHYVKVRISTKATGRLEPFRGKNMKLHHAVVLLTGFSEDQFSRLKKVHGENHGLTVDHVDGHPENNCVTNLEVVTNELNNARRARPGKGITRPCWKNKQSKDVPFNRLGFRKPNFTTLRSKG